MVKEGLADLRFAHQEIEQKTGGIYRQILAESANLDRGNFQRIGAGDFRRLFELYDRHFFEGFFRDNYREKVSFRLSRRMTRSGGKTACLKRTGAYEISLSTALIFQTFQEVAREVTVCGIPCRDRLEATMRILEHEIVHLLELIVFGASSCSSARFKRLSHNMFGHIDVTHRLVTQTELARKKFNLRGGDAVAFQHDVK